MTSHSSFSVSSGAGRTLLEREVTALGEASSSECTECLFDEEESSEGIPSLPPNEPPRAPIEVPVPLAASRKRKKSPPQCHKPRV